MSEEFEREKRRALTAIEEAKDALNAIWLHHPECEVTARTAWRKIEEGRDKLLCARPRKNRSN